MENKEILAVILFENRTPVKLVGVFESFDKATEVVVKDADNLIKNVKEIDGVDLFRGIPNEDINTMLIVAEHPEYSKNYVGDYVWKYCVVKGNLNTLLGDGHLDFLL